MVDKSKSHLIFLKLINRKIAVHNITKFKLNDEQEIRIYWNVCNAVKQFETLQGSYLLSPASGKWLVSLQVLLWIIASLHYIKVFEFKLVTQDC